MRFRFLKIVTVACTIFRHDRLRSKWSQCNSLVRKSYNVVCTYKSKAWFLKVVIAAVFACVLLNMSRVIFQQCTIIASPLVYIPCILSIDSLCFKPILTMDAAAQIPPCRLLSLYIPMYMCVYIANTFASHNGRFRSCKFRNFSSSYASILATVLDSNLNFFGRTNIWSFLF